MKKGIQMCGINGFASLKAIHNAKYRIEKMNTSLSHRGPDATGVVALDDGRLALGQRRLAIVDLDPRSNQPFYAVDGQSVLAFNGEIYNYRELRENLDYEFSTESDTEVLLAGLKVEGVEWLSRCNGMFAFSYYDIINHSMILARDRFGIKTLYYYNDGSVFVFSSEIKGILNSGLVETEFNYDAVDEYLGNRYIREPNTFFKNIYQLPAGCYMTVLENLETKVTRYWELPEMFNQNQDFDEDKVYNGLKEEINKAIKRRMVADVPVGTYLSGGVDSGIISAITSMNTDRAVNTYTIGFPELNEFEYAGLVAKRFRTNHHEIIMNEENYFEMMEEIIRFKDAPLGIPNEIPLALMSKELKKDITVVLSGEGADELLGGYGRIFRSPFDYENIDDGITESFYNYFIDQYEYVPREIRDIYLKCDSPLRKFYDTRISESFGEHSNEENVFRFFHTYHIKGLLQRVDITTMYASVEARVPFLDHELVEYCYKNVPYDLKIKWNSEEEKDLARKKHSYEYSEVLDKPKYLLRRYGMELLPEVVVTRKKTGFPVPLNKWFPEIEDMAKQLLKNADWLKTELIDELCESCKENARSGQLLWMFINIEVFRELYFRKSWKY